MFYIRNLKVAKWEMQNNAGNLASFEDWIMKPLRFHNLQDSIKLSDRNRINFTKEINIISKEKYIYINLKYAQKH